MVQLICEVIKSPQIYTQIDLEKFKQSDNGVNKLINNFMDIQGCRVENDYEQPENIIRKLEKVIESLEPHNIELDVNESDNKQYHRYREDNSSCKNSEQGSSQGH